jgi:acetylornithine deacetylase
MLHALAAATARLPSAPEAACLLVVGEETDHIGARAFAAAPPFAPEHIVLGEPCGVHPASGQKGLLRLRVETTGRAAHSGWPELGTSAIHKLVPALGRMLNCTLPATAQLGTSTLNIGTLQGGVAANVLAPSASALVLVRCAAPTDSILLALREAAGPDVALHIENRVEPRTFDPIATPELSLLPGPPVPFNTDANDLAVLGTSLHLLGPGDMRCAHGPDERLATAELAEGIEAYTRIILALGSPHTP